MDNVLVHHNSELAIHPGYYLKEYIETVGFTQDDFAKRLGTTPKNLCCLLKGEQSLSPDMAARISRVIGTSIQVWLNLQNHYDELVMKFKQEDELKEEKKLFKLIDYNYFINNYNLPEQKENNLKLEDVRKTLKLASLNILKDIDFYTRFKSSKELNEIDIVRANIMAILATNKALEIETPRYNKNKFLESIDKILELTTNSNPIEKIKEILFKCGVNLIIQPHMKGSKIIGATKKLKYKIVLMISDKANTIDKFFYTLFHEIAHIVNNDFGLTFENDSNKRELYANDYANNKLIDLVSYNDFIEEKDFSYDSIIKFSFKMKRNPAIIIHRLECDNLIKKNNQDFNNLKYELSFN